jgi:hypothetical protein
MRPPATNPTQTETTVVRIEWPMNDHGAMTVRVEGSNEVRQLVEFAGESVEETMAKLPAGASVPVRMESLGTRGNVWCVTGLVGRPPQSTPDVSGRDDPAHHGHRSEKEHGEANERAEV